MAKLQNNRKNLRQFDWSKYMSINKLDFKGNDGTKCLLAKKHWIENGQFNGLESNIEPFDWTYYTTTYGLKLDEKESKNDWLFNGTLDGKNGSPDVQIVTTYPVKHVRSETKDAKEVKSKPKRLEKFTPTPSNDNIDILVAVGGKCGSSTLRNTFTMNGFRTIKVHSRANFHAQFSYDGLIDCINASSIDKKLYIIDSYRTPIERKISSFFQNIHYHVPDYENKTCDELISIFNEKFLHSIAELHTINEIMDEYDVEPFQSFDFTNQYIQKTKGNLVFVKILFKDISSWDTILGSILNKNITIYDENLTSSKPTNSIYVEFKQKYKVPITYLHNLIDKDKEFKIYNTKDEMEEYIDKWTKVSF